VCELVVRCCRCLAVRLRVWCVLERELRCREGDPVVSGFVLVGGMGGVVADSWWKWWLV
jgi:hypothetical protein